MKRFQIGFTTVTFREKTPEEICKIALENRVDCLEWGTDVHVPCVEAAREIRRLCDSYGIKTLSLGAYHRIGVPTPTPFSETLESARILGAKRIRIWLGKKSSADFTEEERRAMTEETRVYLRKANAYGIEIAFEFHRKTLNDTGASSRSFLDEIHDKTLSTYWQPFFHETPDADFPFDTDRENLLAVLPHISTAHVFSWDEAANRFPFAKHKEAWRVFLRLLKDSPCEALIMEFVQNDSPAQLMEDLAELRQLLQAENLL